MSCLYGTYDHFKHIIFHEFFYHFLESKTSGVGWWGPQFMNFSLKKCFWMASLRENEDRAIRQYENMANMGIWKYGKFGKNGDRAV